MGDVWDLVVSAFPAPRAAPGSPGDRWAPAVTPPLPLDWPDGPLVYYAYARRMRAGLVDGEEVAQPWARIERRRRLRSERLELVPLAGEIAPLTVQGATAAGTASVGRCRYGYRCRYGCRCRCRSTIGTIPG